MVSPSRLLAPRPATNWLRWFGALLAEELAPRPRRMRTSIRLATIATLGGGLMAAAHVRSALGPYIVWLMLGPVAMMSPGRAFFYLALTAPILAASVPIAGILAESPWLMLPFVGAFTALSTYLILTRKLGSIGLVWQVITLDSFYGVVFAPRTFGLTDAATFGGCAIALVVIAIFDTWIWPDPAEAILLGSIAGSLRRIGVRFLATAKYYLRDSDGERPAEPPATSEMPVQLGLLDRAVDEGISRNRRAVLLAAINRDERLHIRVDRMIIAARQRLSHAIRTMVRPELENLCESIGIAVEELARETRDAIRTGADSPPSPAASNARQALDLFDARVAAERQHYIGTASAADVANFGAFSENLHAIVTLLERPLDEPFAAAQSSAVVSAAAPPADPALFAYCLKVALCVMTGYVIGLTTQRADLSTILTTIIVTALPTYGASLRKSILRIAGAVLGGAVSLLAIIIATPNFESLPSYMLVTFVVLLISAYASLSSGRVAYAGKQLGTTFLLIFAGLSPSPDVYSPLWRAWGILLGAVVVAIVFFIWWPVYAGDSLLPRLRKAIRDTLALIPAGAARGAAELALILALINDEMTQVLSEILQVADDARMEGRRSLIDHEAVVQAAGTIRRIAHRLSSISVWRLTNPPPKLDEISAAAELAVFSAIRERLGSWLTFFDSALSLDRNAARALSNQHRREDLAGPIREFVSRIEANGFAALADWSPEQRRLIMAEIQSLDRLEFLLDEVETHLVAIPGARPAPVLSPALAAIRSA